MQLVGSKKQFLKWIESQIKDDEVLVVSNQIDGQLSSSEKKKCQKVPLVFTSDALSRPYDIGHIAFGKTLVFGVMICDRKQISESALKKLDEAEKKQNL